MLARQYVPLELEDEDLRTILLNAHINDHFLSLAREVNILLTFSCVVIITKQLL